MKSREREPWDRQEGETERQHEIFLHYLHLPPPRPKGKVCELAGIAKTRMYDLSARWKWDDRAQAYDRAMQMAEDEVIYESRQDIAREHLGMLSYARSIAKMGAFRLKEDVKKGKTKLNPREVIAYLEKVVALERLIIGEATERVEGSHDLSVLSDEETDKLIELVKRTQAA